MKKKVLLCIALFGCFFLTGCFSSGKKDVVKEFTKMVENNKGYHLTGDLSINSNEETYQYIVDVSFQKDEQFRVSLKNKTNNHEQIILKNDGDVYVLTPSLNKSFKFQSEWPYNNSQSYLLQTLLQDMKDDKDIVVKDVEDGYVVSTTVRYSSNQALVKQNIYFDKDVNLQKVEVLDKNEQVQISMKFNDIDMKASFDKKYFDLDENMATASVEEELSTVSKIDDVIYPMYIPDNTKLTSQDKVETLTGERVILTFSGEKPFMFVQETSGREDSLTTIPVSGEPSLLNDTIGALTETSATWVSGGVEFYVVSESLTQEELISVVNSVASVPIGK